MAPKPLPTETRTGPRKPTGPFVVVNPRKGVPNDRFYIRNVAKTSCDCKKKCGKQHHKETGRWYAGEIYTGDSVEHFLKRGFIKQGSK